MSNTSVCKDFKLHEKRNLCTECKKPKEYHDLHQEDVERTQSILLSFAKVPKTAEPKSNDTYSWLPPACPEDRIEDYFKCFSEDKVPKYNSEGLQNRFKSIIKQIPLTDISLSDCRFVDDECVEEMKSHIEFLKSNIRFGFVKVWEKGMPLQCPTCLRLLEESDLVVVSSEMSATAYHPACFVCCACREQLVGLVHCVEIDGRTFCIRHCSQTRKPRCHACDELVFSLTFAQARDEFYHKEHLCCFKCDVLLEDNKGFEKNGELYCMKCYEVMYGNDCKKCGKKINLESRHVTFEDASWHYECFTCEKCGDILTTFDKHEDKFYCSKCYNENFAPKCKECREPFEGHTKVVKFGDRIYHVSCFKCCDCKDVIGTGTFVPHNDMVYCKGCHLRNFGVRCFKCHYAITDDLGVMYNKQPYHSNCFTCTNCSTQLAKQPFKHIGEGLYCLNCYGRIFCKSCHSCNQPIILGEKEALYSYGNYRWHTECFVCEVCKSSLGNQTFSMRDKSLICKNCASSQESVATAEAKTKDIEGRRSSELQTRTADVEEPSENAADEITEKSGKENIEK